MKRIKGRGEMGGIIKGKRKTDRKEKAMKNRHTQISPHDLLRILPRLKSGVSWSTSKSEALAVQVESLIPPYKASRKPPYPTSRSKASAVQQNSRSSARILRLKAEVLGEASADNKSESRKTGCSCLPLIIAAVLAVTILIPPAYAERGVGIKWFVENETIGEQTTKCIEYGIYNPWDTDVNAVLKVSDEFSQFVERQESESVFVKAGTTRFAALPYDVCFTIGDIYEEDCMIGEWFCDRTCPKERVEYAGQVIVQEAPRELVADGTSSGATSSVAVPLRLIVECRDEKRDLTPLYYAGGIIAGVGAFAVARRRYSKVKGRKRKRVS